MSEVLCRLLRGKLAENTVRLKKGKSSHWFSDTETLRLKDVLLSTCHQKICYHLNSDIMFSYHCEFILYVLNGFFWT